MPMIVFLLASPQIEEDIVKEDIEMLFMETLCRSN
jgi:hypothetical protein